MLLYKPKYFKIYELVDKDTYEKFGLKAWRFTSQEQRLFIDIARKKWGKATINNWYWGGAFNWSGFRTPDSPYYSPYSQHVRGAVDMKFNDISAFDIRKELKDWWGSEDDHIFPITVEEGKHVNWLHVDFRYQEEMFNSFNVK